MQITSIIFDLDGTLLDTLKGLADTTNKVMQQHNFPTHSINEYKTYIGNGLVKLVERSVPENTPQDTVEQCCADFGEIYKESWRDGCCPYQGIDDMLAAIHDGGISLAVLSNKPHEFTKLFVAHFFPKIKFKAVYGQRPGYDKKPEPGVALEIAKIMSTMPENILFVGDSGVDIQTGKNANMQTAAVSWGFRPLEELEANNPDIIINHPTELLNHVISAS